MRTKNINLARSIFTLFLALVVLIGIAACDKTTTTTTTQAPTTTTSTVTTTTADAEDALAAIELTGLGLIYDPITQRYTTIKDVILPATSEGRAITWASSNAAVLSAAGVCVRPAYGQSDSTVILTATIGSETRDFIIKVLAETVKPISLVLDEAYDALLLSGGISGTVVTADLNLATTVGQDGATVTWESSVPLVIATDGSVYRPIYGTADVSVTLTATISYHLQTRTKTFELYVTARTKQADVTGTIAQALAAGDGKFAHLTGVTVFARAADGFFVADTSGKAFIYTNSTPSAKIIVGNVYDIEAFVDVYYSAYQLGGTVAEPVYFAPSSAAATAVTYEANTIANIMALAKPSETNILSTQTFRITAKVFLTEASGSYNTYLVPETFTGTTLDKNNCLMVYYKSNKNIVASFVGQTITLDVILYAYRTNDLCWAVEFNGTAADITPKVMTDAETVTAVNAYLTMNYLNTYLANGTATFPTSMLGATIAWTFTSEYINLATGAITIPASGQVSVTLTATITKGEATANFSKVVKIGIPVLDTIADAIAKGAGANIRTRGIITAIDGNSVFIQDSTGGLYVYNLGSVTAFKDYLVIGNEIEITAVLKNYFGWMETDGAPSACTLVSSGNALPSSYVLPDLVQATVLARINTLVSIDGLVLKAKPASAPTSSANGSYTFTNGLNDIVVFVSKYNPNVATLGAYLQALAVGSPVNIVGIPVNYSYGNAQFYFTAVSQVVAGTNPAVANVDKNLLTLAAEALSAGTLTLPATGTYGSAITWAIKAGTGASISGSVITFPAVTENTIFTLTATLTIGETSVTKDFDVTVRLLTDAEKVAEAKAAITLANPTQFDVVAVSASGLNGTTLVWEIVIADPAVTLAAGNLTFGYTGTNYSATIKVTITSGAVSDSKEFVLAVTAPTIITNFATLNVQASGAWTVPNATGVYFQGIVSQAYGTRWFIQDENGVGLMLYTTGLSVAIGDKIIIRGDLADYNPTKGIEVRYRQIANATVLSTVSSGNAVLTVAMTPEQIAAVPLPCNLISTLVVANNLIYNGTDGSNFYLIWKTVGETEYQIGFYTSAAPWFGDAFKVGDVVPSIQFTGNSIASDGTKVYVTNLVITMTDAQKVAYDIAQLPASLELTAAYTLASLKYATLNGDPVISAELTANLSYAANVFTPTLGASDIIGTVTVNVISGAVTDSKVINVTVKALSDAEKLVLVKAGLVSALNGKNFNMGSTATLPGTDATFGSTITWASSNEALFNATTGVIGTVTEPTAVTLTATVSVGTASGTQDVSVTVKVPNLIIFELYGAGGNTGATYDRDYIVLYNPTNSAIDLTGYTIQYSSATGTTFAIKATLSGTIGAGEYFVIADTNAGTNGALLPVTADFSVSVGLQLGGTNAKVALANSSTLVTSPTSSNVVDYIGYGTANAFEGTAACAALSATTSAKRSSFVDNNQNSTDFVVGALNLAYLQ